MRTVFCLTDHQKKFRHTQGSSNCFLKTTVLRCWLYGGIKLALELSIAAFLTDDLVENIPSLILPFF